MTIVDRRKIGKNKSVTNRNRFIKRYKKQIRKSIDKNTKGKGITDAADNRDVIIDDTNEPTFQHDPDKGNRDYVLPGNESMGKGDKIYKDQESEGRGRGGSNSDETGEDSFEFTLTKEEFLDIYLSDLALPNFIKETLNKTIKYKYKRAGYTKEGVPPRLNVMQTLKQAIARRKATGSERFLDDTDLRYNLFTKQPLPIKHAVVVMLMDVSASMGQWEKDIAKKFFLLLYLFIEREYESVDLVFIRHTTEAKEVDEHTFFHSRETGGTIVSAGIVKIRDIIEERFDLDATNVYVAQASDGDNWPSDDEQCVAELRALLPLVQYYAYIQIGDPEVYQLAKEFGKGTLYQTFEEIQDPKLNKKFIYEPSDVYPVFRELFEK